MTVKTTNVIPRRFSTGIFCLLILLVSTVSGWTQLQEKDLNVYSYWKYYNNNSNTLYESLAGLAFDQLDKRQTLIESLKTREDWINWQKYVRTTLDEIAGPFPAKTPLNAVITDTIYEDGMRIEKLYFESQPGYYVTAIFCRPDQTSAPLPTIIFCSGHTDDGFRSETYQRMIFNYVKKGFAVLAFDPIGQGERIRYLDKDGKPRMGSTHEHSYPGSQAFLAGISPASYFIWDGIRAVDYVISRNDVDPDRIGITGRSGGGTQTAYIAAVDSRIYAAAPECYITTFDKLLKSNGPQDAEQNLMSAISKGIDLPDYILARAPKPTLIVSTTRDIFSIQGVRDTYKQCQEAFKAMGKPAQIQKVEDDAPHASTVKNREATYSFFREYLNNPGDSKDEEVHIFPAEELWVTQTGNVYRDLGGEDMYSLTVKYLQNQDTYQPEATEDLRRKMIEMSGYSPKLGNSDVVFSGRTQFEKYAIEKYLVKGKGNYYLPVVWFRPQKSSRKAILWIDEEGKNRAVKESKLIDLWIDEGYSIIIADLSGIGELGGGYPGGDARIQDVPLNIWYASILTDKSIVAIHGEDIASVRKFIGEEMEKPADLTLMARGTVASELLQVAFMEDWDERLVLMESLAGYGSILDDREYDARFLMTAIPGGIQYFDIPELIDAHGSDKVLMVDPVDGDNEFVRSEEFKSSLYSSNEEDRFDKILKWLK